MAKPYSQDLRERVIAAVDEGQAHAEVAALLKIGIATVERYLARWRRRGSLKPDKFGGHQRHKLADHEALVRKLVDAKPDRTLMELRGKLAEAGIGVSLSALDRFLRAAGLSYKKNSGRRRTEAARRGRGARRVA